MSNQPVSATPHRADYSHVNNSEAKAMKALAAAYRLKLKRDAHGDPVIQGKSGLISGLWQGRLIVFIQRSTARSWNNARNALALAGCVIHQDGDCEGSVLIDPDNRAQVKLALKLAGIRTKRIATPEQRARLAQYGFQSKSARCSGAPGALESTIPGQAHQEPAYASSNVA